MQALIRLQKFDFHTESLNPLGCSATSIYEIGARILELADDGYADRLLSVLGDVAAAMRANFPDNLFGDLDFMTGRLLQAASADSQGSLLEELSQKIVRLFELYGRHSPIRFQYAHDFIYGFDWARWVGKDPDARSGIGPFDWQFLEVLEKRGLELGSLVRAHDPQYPALAENRYRNVFEFSRAPEHERILLADLARQGMIPVEAWKIDALPCWRKPFSILRKQRAEALGLPVNARRSLDP